MLNIFEDALKTVKKLGEEAGIGKTAMEYISNPEQLITVSLPVRMDNGDIKIFTGYRSRYNTILGPAKGGTRFDLGVDSNEVNGLALWMTIKTALVGLPYGGGKGGITVDVSTLSKFELERLSRAYIRAIADEIGEYVDIMAPDMATNGTIMSWMIDEYEKIKRIKSPGAITGKPIELGGSIFRTEATGYGVAIITQLLVKKLGINKDTSKVAIQGFGNVGRYLAKFLYEEGYKIVAISDVKGGIHCEDGININYVFDALENRQNNVASVTDPNVIKAIETHTGKKVLPIDNSKILELDVDILIPAAKDDVITKENVEQIKAKYIVEAANGPLSSEANQILESKGVIIVPDVLANAGGVTVSYFEWVQNLQRYSWEAEKIQTELVLIMTKAFNEIWEIYEKEKKSLRSSAYSIALRRIEKAINIKYNVIK
ncbi:Glu/Leu/Phe/Val dehydrogenase [Rickettsiales bacterium LUAb2]